MVSHNINYTFNKGWEQEDSEKNIDFVNDIAENLAIVENAIFLFMALFILIILFFLTPTSKLDLLKNLLFSFVDKWRDANQNRSKDRSSKQQNEANI